MGIDITLILNSFYFFALNFSWDDSCVKFLLWPISGDKRFHTRFFWSLFSKKCTCDVLAYGNCFYVRLIFNLVSFRGELLSDLGLRLSLPDRPVVTCFTLESDDGGRICIGATKGVLKFEIVAYFSMLPRLNSSMYEVTPSFNTLFDISVLSFRLWPFFSFSLITYLCGYVTISVISSTMTAVNATGFLRLLELSIIVRKQPLKLVLILYKVNKKALIYFDTNSLIFV